MVMQNIEATLPLQVMHLDYLKIEVTKGEKCVHALIVMGHFTWCVQAPVTSSQTAKCTTKTLWD